jgi:hypothetical protein
MRLYAAECASRQCQRRGMRIATGAGRAPLPLSAGQCASPAAAEGAVSSSWWETQGRGGPRPALP